jgi:hypothetical protein
LSAITPLFNGWVWGLSSAITPLFKG